MREFMGLFRGKRIDNGEWIEGAYCKHDTVKVCFTTDDPKTKHLIVADGFCDWGFEPALVGHEVDPDTVGECTGLRDKNGKLIFEGDILHIVSYTCDYDFKTSVGAKYGYKSGLYVDGDFDGGDFHEIGFAFDYWQDEDAEVEIIGNIHDNPELLRGGEQ